MSAGLPAVQGKFVVPPTLADALEFHRADAAAQLRVALPGQILSYDAAKRTAEVKVLYNRVYNDGSIKAITCPLVDVPVFTLQGGGLHVGLPIAAGDECWVFFADINLDAWHANGGQQTPVDFRRHDIADGFAFVGPNSLGNPLVTALTATEGGLATATSKVAIDKITGFVTINVGGISFATVLNTLLLALQTFFAAAAADTDLQTVAPATATAAGVAATAVGVAIVQLGAMLF